MSHVASVLLIFSGAEESYEEETPSGWIDRYPLVDEINAWLTEQGKGVLTDLADHAGGNKHMQINVWGGAFNYLDLDGFLQHVASRRWEEPEHVTLLWNDEHDEGVTVKSVTDLRAERARSALPELGGGLEGFV